MSKRPDADRIKSSPSDGGADYGAALVVPRKPSLRAILGFRETGVFLTLFVLWLIGSILRPDFFPTSINLRSVLQEMSQLGIVAVGATFALNNGDIDLSVGSVVGLATAVFAVLTRFYNWDSYLAALVVLALGAAVGLANGFLSTKAKMPAFIATLGTLFWARGLALALSGGFNIAPLPPSPFYVLGRNNPYLGGINNQVVALFLVTLIGGVVLWRTVYGYQVYATGGNRQAAILAGINTDRVRIISFVISSLSASLAGLLNIAFLRNFSPTTGLAFELDVVAAAVVGGASIFGGRGTALGAVLGAAILVVIRKILTVGIWLGGDRPWRLIQTANPIFIGIVIAAAVLIDIWVREEKILTRMWARLRGRWMPAPPESMVASATLGTYARSAPIDVGRGFRAWIGRLFGYRESGVLILLIAFWIIGVYLRPDYFPSLASTFNVFRDQIIEAGIIAVGMAFIMINGDIDLSVGSVLSLSAALWSVLVKTQGWNAWAAAALALAAGAAAGLINGLLSTKGRLPSFIATLGMLHLARGTAASLAGGWQLTEFPRSSFFAIGQDNPSLGGMPNQVIIFIIVAVLGGLALWRLPFGYQVYSTGGNKRAATLAGIDTDRVRILSFVICGFLAALSGLITVAKLRSYAPQIGLGFELNVIAAVIVGGVSIFGGRGSVLGAIIGAFVLGYLNSIITIGVLVGSEIRSLPQRWLQIIIGGIIIGAVLFDIWVRDEKIFGRLLSRLRGRHAVVETAEGH